MLRAMRRASPAVSTLRLARVGVVLRDRLPVGVPDDIAARDLVGAPRRREAARGSIVAWMAGYEADDKSEAADLARAYRGRGRVSADGGGPHHWHPVLDAAFGVLGRLAPDFARSEGIAGSRAGLRPSRSQKSSLQPNSLLGQLSVALDEVGIEHFELAPLVRVVEIERRQSVIQLAAVAGGEHEANGDSEGGDCQGTREDDGDDVGKSHGRHSSPSRRSRLGLLSDAGAGEV
jgi:hypothetical protein